MTQDTPRAAQPRLWRNIALASAAVALTSVPLAADTLAKPAYAAMGAKLWLAQETTEGGEGGEGGEAGAAVAPAPEDAATGYLPMLLLIEGHLQVGVALYREGKGDLAITHMKHPKDEIYADLEAELTEYGAAGFADELASLAAAVEAGKPIADVEAAFAAVLAKVSDAKAKGETSPRGVFDAIITTVRVAADEYGVGIVDGKVANIHEYQDAWGFIQASKDSATRLAESADADVKAAAEKALAALTEAETAFNGLTPDAVEGNAFILQSAAAKIELGASRIK